MATVGLIPTQALEKTDPLELNPRETSKLGGWSEGSAYLNEGAWCEGSVSYRGLSYRRSWSVCQQKNCVCGTTILVCWKWWLSFCNEKKTTTWMHVVCHQPTTEPSTKEKPGAETGHHVCWHLCPLHENWCKSIPVATCGKCTIQRKWLAMGPTAESNDNVDQEKISLKVFHQVFCFTFVIPTLDSHAWWTFVEHMPCLVHS